MLHISVGKNGNWSRWLLSLIMVNSASRQLKETVSWTV